MIAYLLPADDFHLEIWAIDVDGKNERKLVSVADLDAIGGGARDPSALAINPYRFDWLPGTHTLAYNTHQVFQGPGLSLLNDLNLVEADTLQKTNLLLSGWGGEFFYSPDGSQIAISQPDKVILVEGGWQRLSPADELPGGDDLQRIPLLCHAGLGGGWEIPAPGAAAGRPAGKTGAADQPVAHRHWMARQPQQIGTILAVPFFEQPVVFSPDLERIAFVKEVGQPTENLRELHLAANDGSGDWVYAKAAALHFLGWAPDASHFAYTLGDTQELWVGSLQETPRQPGGGMNGVQDLRWVDNSRLLFWQASGGSFDLILADVQGGRLLLDSVAGVLDFDFTP